MVYLLEALRMRGLQIQHKADTNMENDSERALTKY